ncbi:fimbrial protein [Enterobacteriaceae bacterium 4M9]|nr:fimbrial protein [Enterobacteriaceae bacterium 4M9]
MKVNKLASALIIALGMSAAGAQAAADQGSGKITFSGSIIDAPCSIDPESSDQEVNLGQVAKSQLENSGTSTPQNFAILLKNCAVTETQVNNPEDPENPTQVVTAPSVTVTFGGSPALDDDNTWFGITGTATGAGVVITDASSNKIPVGGTSAARELIEGNNTLGFSAYLQGLGNTIETGDFQSIADFMLSYE